MVPFFFFVGSVFFADFIGADYCVISMGTNDGLKGLSGFVLGAFCTGWPSETLLMFIYSLSGTPPSESSSELYTIICTWLSSDSSWLVNGL